MQNVRIRRSGRLPHWEVDGAVYFITFHLGDSLPQHVIAQFEAERRSLEEEVLNETHSISQAAKIRLATLNQRNINRYLDRGVGECHLAMPEIANMLRDTLLFFNGTRYILHAWCIMPNHVHLVLRLAHGERLHKVMHSIKGYTALKANRLLERSGAFWQRESYDHIIRNDRAYENIVNYVLSNPAMAGLVDWPYVSSPTDAIGLHDVGIPDPRRKDSAGTGTSDSHTGEAYSTRAEKDTR